MTTAAEIMTHPVKTLSPEMTLREAAQLLAENKISGAPVVDENGKLVGILSESDLLNEARKRAALPHTAAFGLFIAPEDALRRIYHDGASLPVSGVMTTHVLSVAPETTLTELSQLLLKRKINRLPVVDADDNLVGIVTREDILRAVYGLS